MRLLSRARLLLRIATVAPERPKRLVLLGHPVSHSLSPLFQNAALKSAGIAASYDALDVAPDALAGVLRELARGGVAGNVTIPHKEAVAALCAHTTELAARVGAVNTFWHDHGKLVGDNTDVEGARTAIEALVGKSSRSNPSAKPLHVALLGAGGAAAAVLVALESLPTASITVHARTPARAHALAARLHLTVDVVTTADDAVHHADLVINCTPVGLRDEEMPVAIESLQHDARVLDLIPRPGDTAWVRGARAAGHAAEDGTRMLIEQGAAAFERWFDLVPDRASMWRALRPRGEPGTGRYSPAIGSPRT
ncbi:MAG: shikimate dehydrogenase family protein [Gemmatimonas sp.]